MAAAHLRRSVATAAMAALTTAIVPLAASLVLPNAVAFAATAPKMDDTKSAPEPGGALWGAGENITAVFDQAIAGGTGSSSSTACSDTTKCAFVLYEINADGSRGLRLPGQTTITTSSSAPVGGTNDTVQFNPDFNLTDGGTYEALVNVASAADANAKTALDYKLYVSGALPSKLSAPGTATTGNNKAFPLSGYAPPGMTVTVDVPTGAPQGAGDATGTVVVAPCSAISCPWTATVDISGMQWGPSKTGQTWNASVQDANGQPSSPTAVDGPKFDIDYTPPPMPTLSPKPTITNDSTNHTAFVTVAAQDSSTDTKSYVVTITDGASNAVTHTYPAQGTNLPSTQVDVSSLNDGPLHVVVQAADAVGNVSAECDNNPPPVQTCSSVDLTKTAGFVPSLTTSVLTSEAGDTTFSAAQTQSVQTPTKVSVGFTQTIKESWTDCCTTSGSVVHHSSMCVATTNGNCIASGTPTVSSDSRSLSIKLGSTLPDGKYEVQVHTYSATNCDDRTPQNAATYSGCPVAGQYNDLVRIPGTGTPATPFTFTVDSTPPTVTIDSVTNPITATNETGVSASGTVTKGVSSVQVLYTAAGKAPTKLLVNATVTQPSDPSATTATWSAGPSDLSSFPDGTVTIKVTGKKASGLQATTTKSLTMQAHATTLTESTDHARVTAGHAIHVTGHLSDEAGNPIANATIAVRPKYAGGKLGHAATGVTNSAGAYSATFVPSRNATYVASYAGSQTHDAATVSTARTLVQAAVTLRGKASQSNPVTVTGHVAPGKAGKTVAIYLKTASGKKLVAKARLNNKSNFTAHFRLPAGKVRLFATIGATSGNAAGRSGLLVIRVS